MRKDAVGDLIRLAAYAAGVFLLAVVISPLFFQGGKALVEVSRDKETNPFIEWFANWADRAGFGDFFVLTFFGCVLVMLPVLLDRIGSRWLPARDVFAGPRQREELRRGWVGFAVVLLAGGACGLALGGRPGLSLMLLVQAIVIALVSEWFFRGVLFGLLEKRCRPWHGVLIAAFVFAGFRWVIPPPPFAYADEESWSLGWQMLAKLPGHGFENWIALLSLPAWGVLLGVVRMRTVSLWPPVLLHSAWLVSAGAFEFNVYGAVAWSALCAGFAWWCFVSRCHVS